MAYSSAPRRQKLIVAGALVLLIGGAVWGVRGCTPQVEPLAASGFASCTFVTLPDRRPIGDVFEITEGTGTYAEIHIRPEANPPTVLQEATVQPEPVKNWPVSLWVYPLGQNMADGYCAPTQRYRSAKGKPPLPFLSKGAMSIRPDYDYGGPLPRPEDHPIDPDLIVCWTYIYAPPGQTGDLLYEISVYPTAITSPAGRHKYGERAILQRGVLRIVPKP